MFNGFDGSQEEMLHISGFAALERGFSVLTFEGPGQPTVVRQQGLGFRHDWEQVVTPVVDHCEGIPEIDTGGLALLGLSFGGSSRHGRPRSNPESEQWQRSMDCSTATKRSSVSSATSSGPYLTGRRWIPSTRLYVQRCGTTGHCVGTSNKDCGRFASPHHTSSLIVHGCTR